MITENDLTDFDTYIDRDGEYSFIWKVKNIYSMNVGEPKAYKKDLNKDNSPWIDELVMIKPDGERSARLMSVLVMIERLTLSSERKMLKTAEKKYSTGKSISNILIDNHLKDILSEQKIKLAPYVRKLIENDLIEKGLL